MWRQSEAIHMQSATHTLKETQKNGEKSFQVFDFFDVVGVVVVCIVGGAIHWRCVRFEQTNSSLMYFRIEQRNFIHSTWIILQTFFVSRKIAHILNRAKMEKVNGTDFRGRKRKHSPRMNEWASYKLHLQALNITRVTMPKQLNRWIGVL